MRTKMRNFTVILCILLILSGCGPKEEGLIISESKKSEESDFGELPNQTGDMGENSEDLSAAFNEDSVQWEKIEYAKQSGKWFLAENGGNIGFSMTSGEKQPSSEIMISLQPHPEKKTNINRQVRAQLTKRGDEMKRLELLEENIMDFQNIEDKETILSTKLPDVEGALYFLTVEILDGNQNVEDTLLTTIHVPKQEMSFRMYTDNEKYGRDEKLTLFIKNAGSTTIFFGKYYTIEKKHGDSWWKVPLQRDFNDIGIQLTPEDEPYSETISLDGLDEGQYRVIKTIRANGTDIKENLAVSFHIK
jgi:hypothetical protein